MAEAAKAGPPAPVAPKVSKGTKVNVVTAKGEHVAAEVTNVRKENLVDLVFDFNGEEVTITSSPLDPSGTKPDSWHFAS